MRSKRPTSPGARDGLLRLLASIVVHMLAASPGAAQTPPGPAASPEAQDRPAPREEAEPEPAVAPGQRTGLDTIVITPSRVEETLLETPFSAVSISAEELLQRAYRTTPQVLRDVPGVMVQETSTGHGSPYIRGFTGNQNLFLIDGIRLNSSVLRPGPNQYWNTVDLFTVDRLELVKGPSSVLYGSDAIGGTVNALTKSPYAYGTEHGVAGFLHYRGSTAERSHTGRAELSVAFGADTGVLLGVSAKDFGDLRSGGGTLPYTGYDEWSGDVALEHFLSDELRLVVAHQRMHQRDVPRTHSTVHAQSFAGTTVGTDLVREFDQDRDLTYAQLHGSDLEGAVDAFSLSVSWHQQEEVEERVRGNGQHSLSGFDARTLGLMAGASSDTSLGRLSYGVELYRDFVDSSTERFEQQTPADDIQGPIGDDATYDLLGVYLQDEIALGERLDLTLGGRFTHAAADARSVRDPVTDGQIAVKDDWSSVVGSARFTYELVPERWALFGGVSQGFRAPNLADLTRFDSAATDEFEVPAPDLDPERFLQYELGVKYQDERLSTQSSIFFTEIRDQIQRFPTGNVNEFGEREVTKANVGDGYVWGVELAGAYRFLPRWTVFGNATWLDSRVDTFPTSAQESVHEPLDRQMPPTVQTGLRWDAERGDLWAETLTTFAARADELSTRDSLDLQRIPPGGTPSYFVWDVRAGYRIAEGFWLTLAVENILDEDYRVHGSGQNRPGTNAILAATLSF